MNMDIEKLPYLADPWFRVCAEQAIKTPELVANFDRLYGCNLSGRGMPIELAIDEATGRLDEDIRRFCRFVYECVYTRIAHPLAEDAAHAKGAK